MKHFNNIKTHYLPYTTSDTIHYKDAIGCHFIDENDTKYLCLNEISYPLGYKHPVFIDTVSKNIQDKMMPHMGNLSYDKEELINNIMECTNHNFNKVFIAGIGGEVIDWSIKIARNKTGKDGIISFNNALHGRSFAGAFLSGIDRRKKGFGTGLEHIYFYDYPIHTIEDYNKNGDIAAIIIEPYQALGGMVHPSKECLLQLREYTKEHNIVLIFDEIQTGFGKTGTFFAYQHLGIIPDMVLMGKGMSNGFGISGLLTNDDIVSNMDPTCLSGGSSDSDFFCSIVNTVFSIYKDENIIKHVNEMHAYLRQNLEPYLISKGMKLEGNGLFLSILMDEKQADIMIKKCKERHILLGKSTFGLLFRPPLIINKDEIDNTISVLKDSIETL